MSKIWAGPDWCCGENAGTHTEAKCMIYKWGGHRWKSPGLLISVWVHEKQAYNSWLQVVVSYTVCKRVPSTFTKHKQQQTICCLELWQNYCIVAGLPRNNPSSIYIYIWFHEGIKPLMLNMALTHASLSSRALEMFPKNNSPFTSKHSAFYAGSVIADALFTW